MLLKQKFKRGVKDGMGEDLFAESHRLGRRKAYGCLGTFVIWVICLTLIFTAKKWLTQESSPWPWVSFTISLLVIWICPTVGILQAISLKDYFEWSEKKTLLHWLSWFLIFLGSWMLGLVALGCTLMGFGTMMNAFKRGQWLDMIGVSVLTLLLGAVTLYLLLLPFKRFSRETEKQDRLEAETYEYDLRHPKFSEIQRHTQKPLPSLYQSLFAPDSEWIHPDFCLFPFDVDNDDELYFIDRLIPANLDALRKSAHLPGDFIAFASGSYEEFWIQLGEADPAVYSANLEGGGVLRISSRLSTFLNWPRE